MFVACPITGAFAKGGNGGGGGNTGGNGGACASMTALGHGAARSMDQPGLFGATISRASEPSLIGRGWSR